MLITPQPPAGNRQGGFKHGSILDGNFLRAWVKSQRKSTAADQTNILADAEPIDKFLICVNGYTYSYAPTFDYVYILAQLIIKIMKMIPFLCMILRPVFISTLYNIELRLQSHMALACNHPIKSVLRRDHSPQWCAALE